MTLTLRSASTSVATTKGVPLTHAEMDANWLHTPAQLAASSGSSLVGFAQSGSAESESLQSRGRWMVFITDYLSDADRASVRAGTTVNIDTAFSTAHTNLHSLGGVIVFPPGKYKFTAQPTITKRIKFLGAGISESASATGVTVIIKDAAMTTACISLSAAGCSMEGIEVEGEVGNTGDGIEFKATRCSLKDVAVYSMGQDGIRVGDTAGTSCNLWHMERVHSKSNTRHGIYIHDGAGAGPNVNGGTLIHPDVQSNGADGIKYDNAQLNTQIGGAVQSNTGAGVHLTGDADFNIFFGGDWEANDSAQDLLIDTGGVGNSIYNSVLIAANCTLTETNNRIEIADFFHTTTGIQFPATQVSSSDANTLDDYEEGTWTPTITFGTAGDLAVGYSTQVGKYTKIGNQVSAHFEIVTSSFAYGTSSGTFRIRGWPFSLAASLFPTGTVLMSGWTLASVSSLTLQANTTVDAAIVASRSGAATVTLTTAHIGSGSSIVLYGQLTYRV